MLVCLFGILGVVSSPTFGFAIKRWIWAFCDWTVPLDEHWRFKIEDRELGCMLKKWLTMGIALYSHLQPAWNMQNNSSRHISRAR